MSTLLAALVSSALAQGGASPTFCSLRNPSGEKVEFTATATAGGLSLEPNRYSAWPTARAIAPPLSVSREGKNPHFVVGDDKAGLAVNLVPVGTHAQLAIILKLDEGEPKLPVAVGFCSSADVGATRAEPGAAGSGVAESNRAVDPARWSGSECALISRGGREARIEYAPYDGNRATFASSEGWPWTDKVSVSRGQSGINTARVRVTKLGGRRGLSATEYFYVHERNAATVILFDRLDASAGSNEAAAAICGYTNITRAPSFK